MVTEKLIKKEIRVKGSNELLGVRFELWCSIPSGKSERMYALDVGSARLAEWLSEKHSWSIGDPVFMWQEGDKWVSNDEKDAEEIVLPSGFNSRYKLLKAYISKLNEFYDGYMGLENGMLSFLSSYTGAIGNKDSVILAEDSLMVRHLFGVNSWEYISGKYYMKPDCKNRLSELVNRHEFSCNIERRSEGKLPIKISYSISERGWIYFKFSLSED